MKSIKKVVMLMAVGIIYLLTIAKTKLEIANNWLWFYPPNPKKIKFKANTRPNREWAKKVNEGNYDFRIILFDFVWRKTKHGTYILVPSLPNPDRKSTRLN